MLALALAFMASQPLSADENAQADRMKKSTNARLDYQRCIAETPDAFALVDEPAELTTRAVIAFCLNKRKDAEDAHAIMLGNGSASVADHAAARKFYDDVTHADFDFVLAQIISARALLKLAKPAR
jgi:hypothetical protein